MPDVTAGQSLNPETVFSELYETHQTLVSRVIAAGLRREHRDLVEDLVQETYLRLWVHLAGGGTIDNPAGLLVVMARRALADHYRLRRSGEQPTDFSDWAAERKLPASPAAEDRAVTRLEARRLLAEGVPQSRQLVSRTYIRIQAERVLAVVAA
jgi:DNA-directed RNA polymerase specialized sigma24 family protein